MPNLVVRASLAALVVGAILAVAGALAQNVDPNNEGRKFAWGENVGWINAAPDAPGNPGAHVTAAGLTGYLWGENIGWINLSCLNNNTCDTTGNYGVKNDGVGNLSGYAWGENVGWISFSCANVPATCSTTGNYGVYVNPATGEWSGAAWGENIGWINFSHSEIDSRIVSADPDTSGDGYTDGTKIALGKDPLHYCPIMRADVNHDGWVTLLDVTTLLEHFDATVPPAPERVDQNADNEITLLDVTTMLAYYDETVDSCP